MKTWLDGNGKPFVWVDADEKPFVCIEADGEHLSIPEGILYGSRIGGRERAMRIKCEKWLTKHSTFVRYAIQLVIGAAIIGILAFYITRPATQPRPLSQQALEVSEQLEQLSSDEQSQIVTDWIDQHTDHDPPDW
jgi:hypothetical protein